MNNVSLICKYISIHMIMINKIKVHYDFIHHIKIFKFLFILSLYFLGSNYMIMS